MDIVTLISTTTAALKIVKELHGLDQALESAESKSKMADLIVMIAELRIAAIETQDEIRGKHDEIERLKSLLQQRSELIEKGGFKFEKNKSGVAIGYAYCPNCDVSDNKLIRVVAEPFDTRITNCPSCKGTYTASDTKSDYREPSYESQERVVPDHDPFENF